MTFTLAVALALLPQDTVRTATLDTLVVTAERAPAVLQRAAAAVTRISGAELRRQPHATLADLLRLAPGFALVDFDGLGFDPQLMVRGFYGGGQAEYVVVLLDGAPLNQLHTGLVAWDALPPAGDLAAVEVLRGSASALYGDAAIGGIINIITRPAAGPRRIRWTLAGGSHNTWRANAGMTGAVAGRDVSISVAIDRTDGYRAHAERIAGRAHAGITLALGSTRLALSARSAWREFEEPGPLLAGLLADRRDGSDPLFRFDRTRERHHGVGLDGDRQLGQRARLRGFVGVDYVDGTAVRTVALAPGFGDTKEREIGNGRVSGGVQFEVEDTPLPGPDQLTAGLDASWGSSDSRYYAVLTGDRDSYRAAGGGRTGLDAAGRASRGGWALFAQYSSEPWAAIRLVLGARADHLSDTFDPRPPSPASRMAPSHAAFSPKAGLNVRYLRADRAPGNLYLTVSRSFKAPTLDQLFDQRSIPVPFPPFAVTTSNAQLVPQHGTSVEAGLYQRAPLTGKAHVAATLHVYQMDMKDELDFDLAAFRYVNIGRSRHRGVEAGLALAELGAASASASYTLQASTARSGNFAGHALKAIPRHAVAAGLGITPGAADARVSLFHASGMYLDDANTVTLPDYTRVDVHAAYQLGEVSVFLDVANLFGARYHTTGFLDPTGTGEAYFYPAAGRVIQVGVRSDG